MKHRLRRIRWYQLGKEYAVALVNCIHKQLDFLRQQTSGKLSKAKTHESRAAHESLTRSMLAFIITDSLTERSCHSMRHDSITSHNSERSTTTHLNEFVAVTHDGDEHVEQNNWHDNH